MIDKISINSSYFDHFHILTGRPTSLQDLAKKIIDIVESQSQIQYTKPRVYDVEKFYGDCTKARDLLGYVPKIDIEEGLKMTCEELK